MPKDSKVKDKPLSRFAALAVRNEEPDTSVIAEVADIIAADAAAGRDGKVVAYDQAQRRRAIAACYAALWTNAKGDAKAVASNVVILFERHPDLQGVIGHNLHSDETIVLRRPPWHPENSGWRPRPWSDIDDQSAAIWMQREMRVPVTDGHVASAVATVAAQNGWHPIRDYLQGLVWDGVARVDSWLAKYLGAEADDYSAAVGSRWLISAVARVLKPGSKADCMLILEGPQGVGKSTVFKIMVPTADGFTDQLDDFSGKDAAMQLRGIWIVEVSELDTMSRSEVGQVKAFVSRTDDRYRPPYGRRLVDQPRQTIFAGSVNPGGNGYLRDETGNRRFWPVAVTSVDFDGLARDRDQLWAEAMARYQAGEPWWVDSRELREMAAERAAERVSQDPWHEVISDHLENRLKQALADGWNLTGGWKKKSIHEAEQALAQTSVSVGEILNKLGIETQRWSQGDMNRVARTLVMCGWARTQAWIEGRPKTVYRPSEAMMSSNATIGRLLSAFPPADFDDAPF